MFPKKPRLGCSSLGKKIRPSLLPEIIAVATVLAGAALSYSFIEVFTEPPATRGPASIPGNYESMTACEKQDLLWKRTLEQSYKSTWPDYRSFGLIQLLALGRQEISVKGYHVSDFAPEGWRKYLHGRGAMAKVRIVPMNGTYTGIFQGADCALLRLSLTYKPTGDRAVAPGLALKVLRDGTPSANISALVSLDGQGKDFNFFAHPMSNIVPIGESFGQKMVHKIFRKVSGYPEELLAQDMARVDSHGVTAVSVKSPRQLFFIPVKDFGSSSEAHDVRKDFVKIPVGTTLYRIHVAPEKYQNFNYLNYTNKDVEKFRAESEHIADIVTTSEFAVSEFADDGIFFKHQLRK